ncbi:PH domain-containing protein [Paraburkholderia sp. Ac-20340]|uniref:PH domain-containing protein n=1 Tax=Paraburkholderia sp. Ac-20340 TaxID=2703888 RepID=UPI00321762AE
MIFSGTPSQIVNLATFIKSLAAVVIVIVGYQYAIARVAVPWYVPAALLLLIAGGAAIEYLKTAFTHITIDTAHITIDTARITCRQGILNKRVESLELFRVQDVTSLHPWWQRPFGIGTVIALTSDSNNPHWRLPGMRNAEQLRQDLNIAAIALRDAKGIREVNMGRV